MSENRSLKFEGGLGPLPYTAHILVKGGVTGMKYGTLCLTRDDLADLVETASGLLNELEDREISNPIEAEVEL